MDLTSKYAAAIKIILSGKQLKDDTYLNQFLDTTGRLISSRQEAENLSLLSLLQTQIPISKDNVELKIILVRIATVLVKSVVECTLDILDLIQLNVKMSPESDQRLRVAVLKFYSQVFNNNDCQIELIVDKIINWNEDNFILHDYMKDDDCQEVTRESASCYAHMVNLSLRASKIDDKPKKCCKYLLFVEDCLSHLLVKVKSAGCKSNVAFIFDRLLLVLQSVKDGDLDLSFVTEKVDFETLMNSEYITTNLVKCYLILHKNSTGVIEKRLNDILDQKVSIETKKIWIKNIIQMPGLDQFFLIILERLKQEYLDDANLSLNRYLFGFHSVATVVSCSIICPVATSLFSIMSNHIVTLANEDDNLPDKFYCDLSLFGARLVNKSKLDNSVLMSLVTPLLTIVGQKMRFSPNLRSNFLTLLADILQLVELKEEFDDLLSTLCIIASEQVGGWVVRDSALSCLTNLLINPNIARNLENNPRLGLVLNTLKLCRKKENEVFIKTASVRVLTGLLEYLGSRFTEEELIDLFPFEDVKDEMTSEIEKREIVKLAAKIVEKFCDYKEIQKMLCGIILVLQNTETDWEIKLNTVKFWSNVIEGIKVDNEEREEIIKKLEVNQVFTGLLLGIDDYEKPVRLDYYQVIDKLNFCTKLNEPLTTLLKKRSSDIDPSDALLPRKIARTSSEDLIDDNREDNIEDMLEESDRSFVLECCSNNRLKRTSVKSEAITSHLRVVTFEEFQELLFSSSKEKDLKHSSPEDELESVLDDIIQSSSDQCQIDLVDCY